MNNQFTIGQFSKDLFSLSEKTIINMSLKEVAETVTQQIKPQQIKINIPSVLTALIINN
tara:strand:- start:79 stop:255 length:177 start_codon:yes stop_codon:yes gene_type:complete